MAPTTARALDMRRTRNAKIVATLGPASSDKDMVRALFLAGVETQALDAVARAERLTDLRERFRERVSDATRGSANQVAELAMTQPILTGRMVESRLGISRPAALNALRDLQGLGVLVAADDGPRGQLRWRAEEVLAVLVSEE